MFDRWSGFSENRRRLLERSWAGVFWDHLLSHLRVDELWDHFDDRPGRPTKDLQVVIGVFLLQQLHDLTDGQTVEALAFNIAWHYALDMRGEADSYICVKTLRNYRRLAIAAGLDELLFQHLTDRLVRAFANTAPSASRRRLGEAGLDLLALAIQFRDTAACDLASYYLFERVLGGQFDIGEEVGGQGAPIALVRKPDRQNLRSTWHSEPLFTAALTFGYGSPGRTEKSPHLT